MPKPKQSINKIQLDSNKLITFRSGGISYFWTNPSYRQVGLISLYLIKKLKPCREIIGRARHVI